jgi:hypothetical protein
MSGKEVKYLGMLYDLVNLSMAVDKALKHPDNFTDEEIQEACLYAKRKYGADYPALDEAIVQTVQQQRFSMYTLLNCIRKAALDVGEHG